MQLRFPACGCSDGPCADCRDGFDTLKDSWIGSRPKTSPPVSGDGVPALEWGLASAPGGTFAYWRAGTGRFVAHGSPPPGADCYAWFELTLSCPHRCRHCYLGERLGHGHADLGDLQHAFCDLEAFSIGEIVLAGGEPTMHPRFLEILGAARASAAHVRVLTNGWTQLPSVIEAFAQPGVSVEVALLGWGDDHDWMTRTRRSFLRVTQSLGLYRQAGVDLKLTVTRTRQAERGMAQLQAFADGLGVPLETSALMRQGAAVESWAEIAPLG